MGLHLVDSVTEQREEHFPWEKHPYAIFLKLLEDSLTPESTLLDIGCGRRAENLKYLADKAKVRIGVDVDEFTYEGDDLILYQESATSMPSVKDNSVDLAYSASLMEHIEDIDAALQEIHRVLKPGSKYIWLAPNLYHYPYYISSFVPNSWHPFIVNLTEGRAKEDVFPTQYKINTRKEAYDLAEKHNLRIESYRYLGSEPQYMAFSRYAFWLGAKFEMFIRAKENRHWQLPWILVTMTKDA